MSPENDHANRPTWRPIAKRRVKELAPIRTGGTPSKSPYGAARPQEGPGCGPACRLSSWRASPRFGFSPEITDSGSYGWDGPTNRVAGTPDFRPDARRRTTHQPIVGSYARSPPCTAAFRLRFTRTRVLGRGEDSNFRVCRTSLPSSDRGAGSADRPYSGAAPTAWLRSQSTSYLFE